MRVRVRVLGDELLLLVSAEETPTFAEAEQDPNWRRAMIEEMQAINDNQTWELVNPPLGSRTIWLKWVYKVKRDERSTIVKHKAPLPEQGHRLRGSLFAGGAYGVRPPAGASTTST